MPCWPRMKFLLETKTNFVEECNREIRRIAMNQIETNFNYRWPNAYNNGEFNWTILTDPENLVGMARFDAQYYKCNLDPSDRYVLGLTNTSQYRIATDGTGFDNIFFTGGWIKTGANSGSIEGAVWAGMMTSRVISGYPEEIYNQDIPMNGNN